MRFAPSRAESKQTFILKIMKHIKFLVVAAAIVASSFSLSAQWAGGLRIGYSPYTLKDEGSVNASGVMAGFSNGRCVSSSVPMYVDYGVDLHYAWKERQKVKYNFLTAVIPVNIGYLYAVQGSTLSFYPYAGLAAGLNILANAKYQGETADFFDADKDDDGHWKRFQLGAQLGIKLIINDKFTLGYEYRPFVTEVFDGVKTSYNSFFIGVPLRF